MRDLSTVKMVCKVSFITLFASLCIFAFGLASAEKEYSFGQLQATWYQAKVICALEQKNLAKVADVADYKNIVGFLVENGLDNANIWLSASRVTGVWQWPDSTILKYKSWARGQPNIRTGSCLEMRADYKWYAANCLTRRYFICEKEK